ncbi:hypothetical protein B0H14DRAFT_1419305 [Mycena olivaceomarginata]|nr:hypothetical protein B0H14DRAFT_1419305 [Mycena olivaceomarginata]
MSDDYLQSDDPMSEDIYIPCYSQREETAQEVTEQILRLGVQYDAQQNRRAMRLSQPTQNTETGHRLTPRPSARVAQQKITSLYQPKEALDSEADSQEWLEGQVQLNGREDSEPKDRVSAGSGTNDDAQLDFELLRIQFFEMEEERDVAQADCARLRAECVRLQAKLTETERSLKFFQRETGRWRWAAASSRTKIERVLRELGEAATVLAFPDGTPA